MEQRELIKKYRKEKGLGQKELAEILDVSKSTVSAWETGDNGVSLPNLYSIAKALDVPLLKLFDVDSIDQTDDVKAAINYLEERPELTELITMSVNLSEKQLEKVKKIISMFQD